jgi:FKBP12-rapamycin complex-associated protein
VPGTFKSNK